MDDLHYSESHEWVRVDGDTGTIGITDHAQKQLGEIVYLELPEVGHVYNANDEFGTVESVKAVSELFIPVSGEVVEINKSAVAEPGIINDDPQGDGWLIKVKLSTDEEIGKLMGEAGGETRTQMEAQREKLKAVAARNRAVRDYNAAIALYNKRDLRGALAGFQKAAAESPDEKIAADARARAAEVARLLPKTSAGKP